MDPTKNNNPSYSGAQPASRPPASADPAAKQQVVERIKQANKILVTVSTNPSVDQLAACVGLTLMLNKMQKHATAVFSGVIPSTIEFLKPEATIEQNTDSLRDFIISLDKSKADKLRYKVEDQVVRIFITPYKTSLSEKDLVFGQGDFNVEAVIALGVADRRQLDAAITAHGRILHDATVISINAGQGNAPQLGQINWKDPQASSLSEMLVSISESFGAGLIDNQIATAFLTGIVAETERFRNPKTSSKVMTMAAQLMAAGANQQLIAKELEPKPAPAPPAPKTAASPPPPPPAKPAAPKPKPEGILSVSHDASKPDTPEIAINPNEILIDEEGNLKTAEQNKAENNAQPSAGSPKPPEMPPIELPTPPLSPAVPPTPEISPAVSSVAPAPLEQISSEDPRIAPDPTVVTPQNHDIIPLPGAHTLLDPTNYQPHMGAPFTANTEPEWQDPYNSVPMSDMSGSQGSPNDHQQGIMTHKTIAEPESTPASPQGVDNARSAVESAFATAPFDPAFSPPQAGLNSQTVFDTQAPAPPQSTPLTPANGNTPSLPIPGGSTPAVNPPGLDLMQPPPPPLPPPLPLGSNPGAVIPNPPTQPQ
jgi:hypothetical protein